MSAKHPYISGAGSVATMIAKLRNAFPQTVNAETVKKLGLAPNNESYVINALQFIGAIDEEGKKTDQAGQVFSKHNDQEFQRAFSALVKDSYSELFELHSDAAWELDKEVLITFFRNADQTSDIIGKRQATLFQTFAALSGYGEPKYAKTTSQPKALNDAQSRKSAPRKSKAAPTTKNSDANSNLDDKLIVSDVGFGLSVRIEVNLPAESSPDTYDSIFASIRKHLIDKE